MERLAAITRCCEEIEEACRLQASDPMNGLLWEMDQREELHRLLYPEMVASGKKSEEG